LDHGEELVTSNRADGSEASVEFVSTSLAADASFIAMSEIGALLATQSHRLIGGVAVVLHQHRLNLEHPVRATADADFGVPPYVLKDDSLVGAIESIGYKKRAGNRWARQIDDQRTAYVDLLVPSYRTRVRSQVKHGSTTTTEVGGLAEALKRPPVLISGMVTATSGDRYRLDVSIPDVSSLLGLKLHARTVRDEDRDAIDIWTCLELLEAEAAFAEFGSPDFDTIRDRLDFEFGDKGPSMRVVTESVSAEEADRRRTRVRALVAALAT
jgi:predicted nucleotidyltransferase